MKMFKTILLATSLLAVTCSVDAGVRYESPPEFPKIVKTEAAVEGTPFIAVFECYTPAELVAYLVPVKTDDGDGPPTYRVYGMPAYGYGVALHEQLWPPLLDVPNYIIQKECRRNFEPGPVRRV